MSRRNKVKEQEIEAELKSNFGKIVGFEYGTPNGKNRKIEVKYVVGKIGRLERDFTGANYGNSVYIERIDEKRKYDEKILDYIDEIAEKSERLVIVGMEKPVNYREKYYTRRMSDLEIF